ncbi:hypothetical protein 20Aug401_00058 [Pseudomonas phage 20Aug401]|uniref:Uncharacterized protein n=1 Tax=Pseudomonas phage 20Aug401 TaxID=3028482 RepID=A0AAF0JHS1_9CAUD|nr:hypothetical protein 20Aug401_00058 [Pseudomonas phage 20Aug401]
MSKICWCTRPHETDEGVRVIWAFNERGIGVNYVTAYITPAMVSHRDWSDVILPNILREMAERLEREVKLVELRWFRAEILSCGEWRDYRAMTLDGAVSLAEAEWGPEDIGRVIERR